MVSGSKDHLVKLWDPRSGRCLTTLHGHKNTITKTSFERVRGWCLATAARDQTARVFDLRTMRDICLLRGHDKDISTLAWHPVHGNLLSTGGSDGALFHYLLDEPNTPAGQAVTVAPYDSTDPTTAPAQSIFPSHRVPFAHDFAIWSLDWHPLGHILVSGSNDRITRFWTRARPGEDVSRDRYHIGEAAAEAQGTWDRRGNRRQRQEEEEQEMEDEMEGLVDQKMPQKQQQQMQQMLQQRTGAGAGGTPFLPGLSMPGLGLGGAVNSNGALLLPIPPPPGVLAAGGVLPPPIPGVDPKNPPSPAEMIELMKKAGFTLPPLPPPPGSNFGAGRPPPPPPPGFQGVLPGLGMPGLNQDYASADQRRRAPLPSQEDSLREEQKRGAYTHRR